MTSNITGGRWGNAHIHARTLVKLAKPSRRLCGRCRGLGKRVRITHCGAANGVTLMSGCEWHVRKWVKNPSG